MSDSLSAWDIQKYDIVIREHHLDSYGHVNNAMYLTLLEEARWEFITAGGYGYHTVHHNKKGPVVLDVYLSFKKELRLRETITIQSQVVEYPSKVGTLKQTILDAAGQECVSAVMKFGFFDLEARRLLMPTPEWLKALGQNSR
ncbi:MAG: acyl-CoA thioesterase [Bdellovibrionota bacterium]